MIQIKAFFVGDDDYLFYEQIINTWNDKIIWTEDSHSKGRIQTDEDNFEEVDVISIKINEKQTFYEDREDAEKELDYQGYDYAINEEIGRIFAKTPDTNIYKLTPLRIFDIFYREDGYRNGDEYYQNHNQLQSIIYMSTIVLDDVHDYGIVEAILDNLGEEYDYDNIDFIVQNLAKDTLVDIQFIVDGGDETIYELENIEDGVLNFVISGSQPFNVIPDPNIYISVDNNGIIYENGQRFDIQNVMGYEDYLDGMKSLRNEEDAFEILSLFKNIFNLGKALYHVENTLNTKLTSKAIYVPYNTIMSYGDI